MSYPLTYVCQRHDPPLSPEAARKYANESGGGACDALLLVSVMKPKDPGPDEAAFSCMFLSRDGTGEDGPMSANDRFKVWLLMSKDLADDETLSPNKREIAQALFDTIRRAGGDVRREPKA